MQRDIAPDVLRGFALLGILIVNIPFMALSSEEGVRGQWTYGSANGLATLIMVSLFAGKFYILFAFLFGYSSNYIIKDDRTNRGRWVRRSLVLMGLGAIHFTFLWHGDIIFLYGLFGLLLIPFFFRADRTLRIWSRVIFIFFSAILLILAALLFVGERFFDASGDIEPYISPLDEVLQDGSYLDSIAPRVEAWSFGFVTGLFLQGGFVFAAFLLGLRLARSRFLTSQLAVAQSGRMIRRGLSYGLPIQLAAGLLMINNERSAAPSEAIYLASLVITFVTAPLLSMAYVGLLVRTLANRPRWIDWIAPAGRMSLTIYLSQSLATSLIFGPWGLGLFQELQTWAVVLIAAGIWLTLVAFANLWFRRFNQGPLERLVAPLSRRH